MEPEKGKKKNPVLSLVIAKNPNSAYPVFQIFLKSDNFSKIELIKALEILFEADKALKSTGQDPRLLLEHTIISICKRR
jgi:DNA polymerase-3 subunit delta